jgi:single-stranded DNA-binding protein
MNKVELVGRLGKDVGVPQETDRGDIFARFSLAVSNNGNEPDWLLCVAWNKTAEYVSRAKQGDIVAVTGRVKNTVVGEGDSRRHMWSIVAERCEIYHPEHKPHEGLIPQGGKDNAVEM